MIPSLDSRRTPSSQSEGEHLLLGEDKTPGRLTSPCVQGQKPRKSPSLLAEGGRDVGWELAATCPCPGGIAKTLTAVVTLQAGEGWDLGEATCAQGAEI